MVKDGLTNILPMALQTNARLTNKRLSEIFLIKSIKFTSNARLMKVNKGLQRLTNGERTLVEKEYLADKSIINVY